MKYIVELEISAYKTLLVEAANEEDAELQAQSICNSTTIPVYPDDVTNIVVADVYEDFLEEDDVRRGYSNGQEH